MDSVEKGYWNSISFHPSTLLRSWREMGALLVVSHQTCWVAKAGSWTTALTRKHEVPWGHGVIICQLSSIVEFTPAFVAIWTKWVNSTQQITMEVFVILFNEPPYSPFSWHRLGQGRCLACQRFITFQGFCAFCASYLVASTKSLRNLIPIQSPMDGRGMMDGMDGAVGHLFAGSLDWKAWHIWKGVFKDKKVLGSIFLVLYFWPRYTYTKQDVAGTFPLIPGRQNMVRAVAKMAKEVARLHYPRWGESVPGFFGGCSRAVLLFAAFWWVF